MLGRALQVDLAQLRGRELGHHSECGRFLGETESLKTILLPKHQFQLKAPILEQPLNEHAGRNYLT